MMLTLIVRSMFILFGFMLVGCEGSMHFAPVTDLNAPRKSAEPAQQLKTHSVAEGDTLYSIAWRYGMDYRKLANINHIKPPYLISLGQVIHLEDKNKKILTDPSMKKGHPLQVASIGAPEQEFFKITKSWIWPAKGKVLNEFSPLNKGINIIAQEGDPIFATAAGRVVYCGSGLRGYGNLIILKHNNIYFSAYAHNRSVYVKEGEWVYQGQKIAEMGRTGTNRIMLHFEIRKAGSPIDPINFLKT